MKITSAEEAVGIVKSGDRVFFQGAAMTPNELIDALLRSLYPECLLCGRQRQDLCKHLYGRLYPSIPERDTLVVCR